MKKSDIKNFIKEAIDPRKLCRVNFKYDTNYRYCFPVIVSDKLFMGANEYDFLLDGFTISRFKDVANVKIEENKYLEITKEEGIVDGINIPDINLSDWYNVFVSLQKMNKNIIVEREDVDDDDCIFAIGKISKVTKTKVYMKHFDADGIWEDELWEIPFTKITSVSFGTRYVEIFSKYI